MKILFIHQGFPGQYKHIVNKLLLMPDISVYAMGLNERNKAWPSSLQYFQYKLLRGSTKGIHQWASDFETKIIRGESCAVKLNELKIAGLIPDIICLHPGWGEGLFIREIWPEVPILCYQEFFYNPKGTDFDFDPEFQGNKNWSDYAWVRSKSANPMINLNISNWNVTPTKFQKSTFPAEYLDKISIIHDGIDTIKAKPLDFDENNSDAFFQKYKSDRKLITFVNRTIEPYRGAHKFIRAIPEILKANTDTDIVIIGKKTGVSYGKESDTGSWSDQFLCEIDGKYDKSRLHMPGLVSYSTYLNCLQHSSVHVYLTYPFVASWSLLEAMSVGCAMVASSTEPVKEFITDQKEGLLVDFFDSEQLVYKITELLNNRSKAKNLGKMARKKIVDHYRLDKCVDEQINLIFKIAGLI